MSKKTYETLKESLCYELDGLTKRGDINKDTLDSIFKLVKSIKSLEQLINMDEKTEDGGYSMTYRRPYMGRSYDGHSYHNSYDGNSYDGNSYHMESSYDNHMSNDGMSRDYSNARAGRDGDSDGRYSEARGRDARGRYTSRDRGYSRHSAKDRIIQRLEDMLDESDSGSEKVAIMKCIEDLQD